MLPCYRTPGRNYGIGVAPAAASLVRLLSARWVDEVFVLHATNARMRIGQTYGTRQPGGGRGGCVEKIVGAHREVEEGGGGGEKRK